MTHPDPSKKTIFADIVSAGHPIWRTAGESFPVGGVFLGTFLCKTLTPPPLHESRDCDNRIFHNIRLAKVLWYSAAT
jgi:hypothetical protein